MTTRRGRPSWDTGHPTVPAGSAEGVRGPDPIDRGARARSLRASFSAGPDEPLERPDPDLDVRGHPSDAADIDSIAEALGLADGAFVIGVVFLWQTGFGSQPVVLSVRLLLH